MWAVFCWLQLHNLQLSSVSCLASCFYYYYLYQYQTRKCRFHNSNTTDKHHAYISFMPCKSQGKQQIELTIMSSCLCLLPIKTETRSEYHKMIIIVVIARSFSCLPNTLTQCFSYMGRYEHLSKSGCMSWMLLSKKWKQAPFYHTSKFYYTSCVARGQPSEARLVVITGRANSVQCTS